MRSDTSPPWDHAQERVADTLIDLEMRTEDRAGNFTLMAIGGMIAIGVGIWQIVTLARGSSPASPLLLILAGYTLAVCGVALRINSALEMKHLRRMQKINRKAPR